MVMTIDDDDASLFPIRFKPSITYTTLRLAYERYTRV